MTTEVVYLKAKDSSSSSTCIRQKAIKQSIHTTLGPSTDDDEDKFK